MPLSIGNSVKRENTVKNPKFTPSFNCSQASQWSTLDSLRLLFDTPRLDGAYHSRYLVRGGVHVLQGRPSITGRTQRHRRAIICAHTDSYDHLNHHLSNIFGLWEETRPLGRKTNQRRSHTHAISKQKDPQTQFTIHTYDKNLR